MALGVEKLESRGVLGVRSILPFVPRHYYSVCLALRRGIDVRSFDTMPAYALGATAMHVGLERNEHPPSTKYGTDRASAVFERH